MHLRYEYPPDGPRERFAGMPVEVLTGGAGYAPPMSPQIAPQNGNGATLGLANGLQPHHGAIAMVLFAVAVLFLLDRAGFRFAVTAGKR